MSCVNQKQVEPIILNFESNDTKPKVGKPCIDFQPDDRWQIKEDEQHANSGDKSSATSAMKESNKSKCQSVTINGESVQSTVKKEGHKNSVNAEVSSAEVKEIPHAKVEPKVQTVSSNVVQTKKDSSSVAASEAVDPPSILRTEIVDSPPVTKTEPVNSPSIVKTEHVDQLSLVTLETVESPSTEKTEPVDLLSTIKTESAGSPCEVKTDPVDSSPVVKTEPAELCSSDEDISDSNSLVFIDLNKSESSPESVLEGVKEGWSKINSPNGVDLKKDDSIIQVASKTLGSSLNHSGFSGNPENVLPTNLPGSSRKLEAEGRSNNKSDANLLGAKQDSKHLEYQSPCDKDNHVASKDFSTDINGSDTESKDGVPPKLENCSKSNEQGGNSAKDMPDISGDVSVCQSSIRKAAISVTGLKSNKNDEIQVIHCISSDSEGHSPEKLQTACMSDDFNLFKSLNGVMKAGKYKPVKFPHTGSLTLADNEVIIESPSLLVPLLIKEMDIFPPKETEHKKDKMEEIKIFKEKNALSKDFFQSSVGKFLIGLGMSRVQEWYHRDMKRSRLKQMRKLGMENEHDDAHDMHHKAYSQAKAANSVFNFRLRRCQFCDFKSESRIVMDSHYLIPHLTPRREFRCNFCPLITRDPKEIVFHFEAIHGKRAILDVDVSLHECPFCCFQSRLKTKVTTHINRCRKHFSFSHNQAPPFEFEFPGVTTKPVTIADVMAHRALLMNSSKGRTNQQLPISGNSAQSAYARKKLASVLNKMGPNCMNDGRNPTVVKNLLSSQGRQIHQISPAGIQLPPGIVITRPRANASMMQNPLRLSLSRSSLTAVHQPANTSRKIVPYVNSAIRSAAPRLGTSEISITPVTKSGIKVLPASKSLVKNITLTPIGSSGSQLISQKSGQPQPVALFTSLSGGSVTSRNLSSRGVVMSVQSQMSRMPMSSKIGSPRVHIPYQRLNTPPSQVVKSSSGNTFVMCEICDSYIKDLEELRTHMNWVHKVKIHPKMLVSRPPLNCQKCQWRFFTDQGLERHLLGAHGLVTTNMQEMANKNQDGGRCIICGAVFTYKLVSHMTQVHKVTLKPAHLSYKCTVCTATFTLYRLFESHVYNVHSGSAKRPADDSTSTDAGNKKARVLPTPAPQAQPPPPPPPPASKEAAPVLKKCRGCAKEVEDLEKHIIDKHMKKCSVKLCHIEKCEKCLYSSDEMLVIRMSDFGLGDESDEESDEESESDSGEEICEILKIEDDIEEVEKANASETEKVKVSDGAKAEEVCKIESVSSVDCEKKQDEAA